MSEDELYRVLRTVLACQIDTDDIVVLMGDDMTVVDIDSDNVDSILLTCIDGKGIEREIEIYAMTEVDVLD